MTVDDLIAMIGRKQIEVEMLRTQNKELVTALRRAQAEAATTTGEDEKNESPDDEDGA